MYRWLALFKMVTKIGPVARYGRHSNALIRARMLEALSKVGLFDYLVQPRTYEDILMTFDFHDTPYTRDVFEALADPKIGVLTHANGQYSWDPDAQPLPVWNRVAERAPAVLRKLTFAYEFAGHVPARMRGENLPFAERLEKERNALLNFDDTLSNRIYGGLREVAYTWARPYLDDPAGKTLLDVGCGSGQEVAHLWLLFGGKVKITAVDPVPSFVAMAEERFPHYLRELSGGRAIPEITDDNRPLFYVASADDLPFPAQTFDMVFHSQILHWTADVRRSVGSMLRVLKVGGVIFGTEVCKPTADRYMDLMFRMSDNIAGTVWLGELERWFGENGCLFENLAVGIHRARKQQHLSPR